MKSILVIGLGNFGMNLAKKMLSLGNEVLVIDKDEKIIQEVQNLFTEAYSGDCTKENTLKSLGINNFDFCYVSTGSSFQASLEITSLLKELGAKHIVAKATNEVQAKFLKQIGADEVVFPEKDMAISMAIKHNANNVFDYIQLGEDYALFEIPAPKVFLNKSIVELNVRQTYKINVIAIRKHDGKYLLADPNYVFEDEDHLVILARQDEVKKISKSLKK